VWCIGEGIQEGHALMLVKCSALSSRLPWVLLVAFLVLFVFPYFSPPFGLNFCLMKSNVFGGKSAVL
jgi:hypothetical protein